ncbi:MAG TPA: hypothetical protein VIN33_09705 [Marinobacter sp.]
MPEHSAYHETDSASVRPLWAIMLSALALVLAVSFIAWLVIRPDTSAPGSARYDQTDLMSEVPRLQRNPTGDLEAFNQRMTDRLNSTGWVDREEGVVHMPINQAMELLVERGLPEDPQ